MIQAVKQARLFLPQLTHDAHEREVGLVVGVEDEALVGTSLVGVGKIRTHRFPLTIVRHIASQSSTD